MKAENSSCIPLIICAILAVIMIVIGIRQMRKDEPASFFAGQKTYTREELEDVEKWNQLHGLMWIIYGLVILCCYCIGMLMGDTAWSWIPILLGIVIPPFVMVVYHKHLEEKYLQK